MRETTVELGPMLKGAEHKNKKMRAVEDIIIDDEVVTGGGGGSITSAGSGNVSWA